MLTLRLVCVGRLKAGAENELCRRYLARARQSGRTIGVAVDVREIPEARARQSDTRKLAEAQAIRSAIGPDVGGAMLAFDERGRTIGSDDLAAIVKAALEGGSKTLDFVIGGPDGLDASIRKEATDVIALGAMTWPHQLVRAMITEQIYRVTTILTGHPYHRA